MTSPPYPQRLLFRGIPDPVPTRMAIAEFCQRLWPHELQPFRGVVAMDLLDIELAHEVDGFLSDDLAGHHDREAGRIRNDETGRDQLRTILQAPIDLGVGQTNMLAPRRVVGGIEAAANIAFI